jgi:multiple sugar transport system substrate-binding protein
MKKVLHIVLPIIVCAFVTAGCGSSKPTASEGSAGKAVNEPVTLTVGIGATYLTEEEFKRYITDPVQKKYPWITAQRQEYAKGKNLSDLVAAGQTPDLVVHNNINGIPGLADLGLLYSYTDLIKKNNMDLGRFEPEALDAIKAASQREDLVALPYTRHTCALYYNKDIFDKFGIPYPKDGMTWDEVFELAKKVTRKEDNIQYRGLEPNVTERPASQLSLPYVDPKTLQSLINTDQWKKVVTFMAKIHQIPGNSQITYHSAANDLFAKDKTLAMLATNNIIFDGNLYKTPDLNWDMVSYPTWSDAPGIGLRIDEHFLAITTPSQHKADAFNLISTVVSDEVQTDFSRHARLSILKDPKIGAAFGADLDFMKGKNIQAVYKTKPAKSFVPTKYDPLSATAINNALKNMVSKGMDVNTALREAEDSANKQIKEKESQ